MNETTPTAAPPKQVFSYSLWVVGLFGRNRKAKKQRFDLAEVPVATPLGPYDIEAKVKTKTGELKVKSGAKLVVTVAHETIEENVHDGILFVSHLFGLFDSQKVYEAVQP